MLSEKLMELADEVAQLERGIDILRSQRSESEVTTALGPDPEPAPDPEAIQVLRELRQHVRHGLTGTANEWWDHLQLLLHRADAALEQYPE